MYISASLFISYSVIHTELYDTQEKLELITFFLYYMNICKKYRESVQISDKICIWLMNKKVLQ